MRVGIVGAGISGLAAARILKANHHEVVVFEKNDHVGGRCATQRLGDYLFDPGASAFTPRGHAIENVILHELDTTDLIKIEKPIYLQTSMRPSRPPNVASAPARYTYKNGNATLANLLANNIEVRLNTNVETLQKEREDRYKILGEDFDAVILTPPVPQVSAILWSIQESRAFANVAFRPCLSIMLGFDKPIPDTAYSALLDPEQHQPLMWLSLESVKSPGRAPAGKSALVAQMSPPYSLTNFANEDSRIIGDALDYLSWLFGAGYDKPEVAEVKRWKYSQPDTVALFETVNEPGSRVIIAGDGVVAGRTENAYDSGLKAAALLVQESAVQGSK